MWEQPEVIQTKPALTQHNTGIKVGHILYLSRKEKLCFRETGLGGGEESFHRERHDAASYIDKTV